MTKHSNTSSPTSASLDIRTARQFFDHVVVPSLEDLKQDPLSSRKAITCAIVVWAQWDWLKRRHGSELAASYGLATAQEVYEAHVKRNRTLSLVREVANGSKHSDSEASDQITDSGVRGGDPVGLLLLITNPNRHVLVIAGQREPLIPLLEQAVEHWRQVFRDHLPNAK